MKRSAALARREQARDRDAARAPGTVTSATAAMISSSALPG